MPDNHSEKPWEAVKPKLEWSAPSAPPPMPKHISSVLPTPMTKSGPVFSWFSAVIGFAAGVLAMLFWAQVLSPSAVPEKKEGPIVSATSTPQSNRVVTNTASAGYLQDSVTLVSPQSAGHSVMLTSISVSVPTWAVVYDEEDHLPGKALGAQLFFPGQTSGVITLVRATVSGGTYLVGLQVDDEDHVYEHYTDPQVIDADGRSVLAPFVVQ